jgi:hypothetical protein
MTPKDLRILCTALGFTAVVAREGPGKDEASKAMALGRLIESFCLTALEEASAGTVPDLADLDVDPAAIDDAIDRYKADFRDKEAARLPPDRATLLQFYDRLLQRKTRWEQRHFYATAPEDMIANLVAKLVEEEIDHEEGRP